MIRILIIEDNAIKAQNIQRCLKEHYPDGVLDIATAYASGVRRTYKEKYDVVIIDNSLPYYESAPSDIHPDMARIILDEFFDLGISPNSIICSAFDPGEKEVYFQNLVSQFDFCIGFVRYDGCSSDWENQLLSLIDSIKM